MSIDTEPISGVTGERCTQTGRYRVKRIPDVTKYIWEGTPFPPHNGASVTWVFDEHGTCPPA